MYILKALLTNKFILKLTLKLKKNLYFICENTTVIAIVSDEIVKEITSIERRKFIRAKHLFDKIRKLL